MYVCTNLKLDSELAYRNFTQIRLDPHSKSTFVIAFRHSGFRDRATVHSGA